MTRFAMLSLAVIVLVLPGSVSSQKAQDTINPKFQKGDDKCNPNVTCGAMPGEITKLPPAHRTGKFKLACVFYLSDGGKDIDECPDVALTADIKSSIKKRAYYSVQCFQIQGCREDQLTYKLGALRHLVHHHLSSNLCEK